MQEIIDEIESAANRCKVAATELKSPFINAGRSQDAGTALATLIAPLIDSGDFANTNASLIQRAQEAIAAFDNVRVRIVPLLEVLLDGENHAGVRAKLSAIRRAVQHDGTRQRQVMVLKKVAAMVAESPEQRERALQLWAFMDSMAEVLHAGIIATTSLPKLSEKLVYIAMYFKGKHARSGKLPVARTPENGDTIMGSKIINHISGANIGAFGQGDGAVVTGNLSITTTNVLTQEKHKEAITKAQNALNADQDVLERIDERLYEALGQFLRLARQIQVEQASMAEIQAKMKATLDDVWAEHTAKGMKPSTLPQALGVIKELTAHPAMVEVVKRLIGA
jgi:hypothetical protein